MPLTSLPNLLTLSRILAVPLVVATFYVPGDYARWFACALFSAAGFTDWLDGHMARRWAQQSELGLEDIAIVGIAKGPDRDAGRERFFMPGKPPFSLEPRDPVLYFLQRLRDEAHRFAIGTHRTRRAADITKSALDEVPGIGSARKRALLHHFGSARAVGAATLEDIKSVPGISGALAQKIHDHFRGGR